MNLSEDVKLTRTYPVERKPLEQLPGSWPKLRRMLCSTCADPESFVVVFSLRFSGVPIMAQH